jgi:two-component system, response regulator
MNSGVILLVEDNPDDVRLTLRALQQNHIANPVVVARDGAEAIDYLVGPGSEGRDLSAVLLLDLKLPRVDGLEVLRRIRAEPRTRLLRVVGLTSSREEPDVLQSYATGANSHIRKPVDFEAFVTAVGQLGLYWLLHNEPPPAEACP